MSGPTLRCRLGFHHWQECAPRNLLNVLGRYCERCGIVQDFMMGAGGYVTVGRLDRRKRPHAQQPNTEEPATP